MENGAPSAATTTVTLFSMKGKSEVWAALVDDTGGVVLAGKRDELDPTHGNFYVSSLASDGATAWERSYDGGAVTWSPPESHLSPSFFRNDSALAVSATGTSILSAGFVSSVPARVKTTQVSKGYHEASADLFVRSFSRTGDVRWSFTWHPKGEGHLDSAADFCDLRPDGRAVIVGQYAISSGTAQHPKVSQRGALLLLLGPQGEFLRGSRFGASEVPVQARVLSDGSAVVVTRDLPAGPNALDYRPDQSIPYHAYRFDGSGRLVAGSPVWRQSPREKLCSALISPAGALTFATLAVDREDTLADAWMGSGKVSVTRFDAHWKSAGTLGTEFSRGTLFLQTGDGSILICAQKGDHSEATLGFNLYRLTEENVLSKIVSESAPTPRAKSDIDRGCAPVAFGSGPGGQVVLVVKGESNGVPTDFGIVRWSLR